MSGGDNYKVFDTSSIVSSADTQGTVKVGRIRFRKRDLVFGGIALLALLMVLVLAIVLAVEVGRNDSDGGDAPRTGASSSMGKSGNVSDITCISHQCLKTAHYQKSIMDDMISPCEDFYSFACGHFAENNPQSYILEDVTPMNNILRRNIDTILDLITSPVDSNTQEYERKLKHFVSSCTNHFDKMDLRGRPLVEQVLRPYGPIYFLDDDFHPAEVDLHRDLLKTHVDFWTAAFFTVNVVTDQTNWNKKVVELDSGGLGMGYELFLHELYAQQAMSIYRDYMTHVLSLVSIDAGTEINTTKIANFVDDVIYIEYHIAAVIDATSLQSDRHQEVNRMSLGQLNDLVNNTIDFTGYMQYAFNQYSYLFTDETTVSVRREGYFHLLGGLITQLHSTEDGKRMLSNYLVWTLINRYSHDLSWDYIHTKRKLNNYLYGQKDDSSGFYYCFEAARTSMGDAMDAVFVKNNVKTENKVEADKIVQAVKAEMLKGIDALGWMTEDDRQTAHTKIVESLYKIGYANYMVDDTSMNALYEPLKIDETDYFGNMLNLNTLYRRELNTRIGVPQRRTQWVYHVFDPIVEYYNPWKELIATAAVFQSPLFMHDGLAYYNFGSVGSMIAKHLIHAVDEIGSFYRDDGQHYGDWWANVTYEHYETIRTCAIDAQAGTDLGTYSLYNGLLTITPNVTLYAADYAPELLADSSGLRLAYNAFQALRKSQPDKDITPVGFPERNTDQLFFMAYAQTNCQNTPSSVKLYQLNGNQYPSKNRVNLAVSQVPEFAEAFKCSAGQPMVPKKQCTLF